MAQPRDVDPQHGVLGEGGDRPRVQLRAADLHTHEIRAHDGLLPHTHREAGQQLKK